MRSAAIKLTLSCIVTAAVLTGQGSKFEDPQRRFTLTLPPDWRQMTPDEALKLRSTMPADVATLLVPGRLDRFGAVDRWLKQDFDGQCLTIQSEDGEPAMDDETLEEVRATARAKSAGAKFRYVVESLEFVTLGPSEHRGIELDMSIRDSTDKVVYRVLEYVVPSAGATFRFSYRAAPDGFAAAMSQFRQSASTIDLARPAQGRKELSDKLRMPLIIGAVVGLVLLVLYKMNRG